MAAFVAELRQLSEHCEFGTTLEDLIRDRLVCGVANSSIQRRLLAEQNLTLKQAHDLARAIETAEKNVRDLQGQKQSTAVHTVTHRGERSTGRARRTLVIGAEGSTYRNNVVSRPAYVTPARNEDT